jgi:hypothetical protein
MQNSIVQIPTNRPRLYAFEIRGEVQSEDMHEMAETMNSAFDAHDKVDMMLLFRPYDGSEIGATFDFESMKASFRSLNSVDKYVVVGAPERADSLISFMDRIIPVDAHTFEPHEVNAAWSCVDAQPLDRARVS